jgi:hypothetical protein
MTNIVEKGTDNTPTASSALHAKAYRDLAKAASKADGEGGESNTKTLAFPSAVALNLQIISDIISAMDDAEGGSKYITGCHVCRIRHWCC